MSVIYSGAIGQSGTTISGLADRSKTRWNFVDPCRCHVSPSSKGRRHLTMARGLLKKLVVTTRMIPGTGRLCIIAFWENQQGIFLMPKWVVGIVIIAEGIISYSSIILLIITSGTFSSRPNVDDISAFDPFLPNNAESLLESGEFFKVPVLWGTNSGEGILNAPDYIKRWVITLGSLMLTISNLDC